MSSRSLSKPPTSTGTSLHPISPANAANPSTTSSHSLSHSHSHSAQQHKAETNKKFVGDSTRRIIELADLSASSDTADLIQRSVAQHVEYEERLKHHKDFVLDKERHSKDKHSKKKVDVQIMDYIQQLTELVDREMALAALSNLREKKPDLAPLLWGTPAVIAALIQEVISVYPYLSGNIEMNSNHSNRCCNALALLQCVASHPETRGLFLKAYIPLFLYPFLNTELNSRPFEYLRLTSLGVIGALVKHPHPNVVPNSTSCIIPDSEVTEFLVKTEAIPLCLHIMEYGNELSQTVATFIIQKILLDNYGLNYVCKTSDRFFAISCVLTKMIQDPDKKPSKKLIKHVVRCYLRLCDDNRAYLALHSVLPKYLQSQHVEQLIAEDEVCLQWLKKLRMKHKESVKAQEMESQKRKAAEQQALYHRKRASAVLQNKQNGATPQAVNPIMPTTIHIHQPQSMQHQNAAQMANMQNPYALNANMQNVHAAANGGMVANYNGIAQQQQRARGAMQNTFVNTQYAGQQQHRMGGNMGNNQHRGY